MTFDTYEQAEDYYYSKHQCDSDDVEREQQKIDRWLDQEGHTIKNE